MAIKTVLDTLDGVDDAVKALYIEKDGKHVLDLEGVDAHPEVANLKSAYERTKADKATLKLDAEKARADLAATLRDKPDEAALLKLRQDLEAERDGWKGKAEDALGKLTGATRDRQLAEALQAANITDPTFIKAATAMLAGSVKMDGDKAIVETDMGPMGIGDHIKRWAASEGKAFVTPAQGGGAGGSQSQNGGKVAGNLGGTREERVAALKAKFPDLT